MLITPWNAPLMLATWKVAPALAAGDTVVLKPAEWTPLTASLLADIAAEAGLPAGVLNVVQGFGEEVGAALVAHPGRAPHQLHRLGADGPADRRGRRPPTSRRSASNWAASRPLLVFADADLDLAVDLAVEQYDNAGQVCLAGDAAAGRGVDRRRVHPAVRRASAAPAPG